MGCKVPPTGLTYATVHKTRVKGRVVKVEQRVIHGTTADAKAALPRSASSRGVNMSFMERQDGTDCNRNARRSDCFSKDWSIQRAITDFARFSVSFS